MINQDRVVRDVVLIGASAGGLEAIVTILKRLPGDLAACLGVVLHRSPTIESQLPFLLSRRSTLPVQEPADGEAIRSGFVYVAPRDVHLTVNGERWRLSRGATVHFARPSVDSLFSSGAVQFKSRVVGILLSGGGADGVSGLIDIKSMSGICIAQEPGEALFPSMPARAILDDHIDAVMRVADIAAAIPALVAGEPVALARAPR